MRRMFAGITQLSRWIRCPKLGKTHRLVTDNTDGVSVYAGETTHEAPCPVSEVFDDSPSLTTSGMTFFMSLGVLGDAGKTSRSASQR
jgi:hypothetical protein